MCKIPYVSDNMRSNWQGCVIYYAKIQKMLCDHIIPILFEEETTTATTKKESALRKFR